MNSRGITLLEAVVGSLLFSLVSLGILRGLTGSFRAESKLRVQGDFELTMALALDHILRTGKLALACREEGGALVCDTTQGSVRFFETGRELHYDTWEMYPPPVTPDDPTGSHWVTKLTYADITRLEICDEGAMMLPK